MTQAKKAIIVLGMHRSGTSALTGCLGLLGVTLGTNLMPAHPEFNARGHWEHSDAAALNEQLLAALERTWQDERRLPAKWSSSPTIAGYREEMTSFLHRTFSSSVLWGLKDPRLCRLLPLWLEALRETQTTPVFIFALRHPAEVARSLARRNDMPEARAYLLWLIYMLEAERASRDYPRAVVSYEALLADWHTALSPLNAILDIDLPVDTPATNEHITAFLSPALRHFSATDRRASLETPLHALAEETYQAFSCLNQDASLSPWDALYRRTDDFSQRIAPWSTQIQDLLRTQDHLKLELARMSDRNALLADEVARIKSTVSWRITRPLRLIWNRLHKTHPNKCTKL